MRAITEEVPNTLLRELGPERAMELAEREPDQLNEMVREVVSGVIETGARSLPRGSSGQAPRWLLAEMEEHVRRIAEDEPSETEPHGFNIIATRDLKAGELVRREDYTLKPPKKPKDK